MIYVSRTAQVLSGDRSGVVKLWDLGRAGKDGALETKRPVQQAVSAMAPTPQGPLCRVS